MNRVEEVRQIVAALAELLLQYPSWRVGQTVCNVAAWARDQAKGAVWDMEDHEFIAAIQEHLERNK